MKYIKSYKKIKEGKLQNIAAGIGLAASSLTSSCKKPGYEYQIKFGSKTGTVVADDTPNSQIDYIGDKSFRVIKSKLSNSYILSKQWAFSERPTPEQLSIMASYYNFKSELKNPYNKNPDINDNVVFYDLSDVKLKESPIDNVTSEESPTSSEFYAQAFDWCENNLNIFQKDLDQLKNNTSKPEGIIGELIDFDASSIINKPENKPKK